jgi:hypothetical protein
MRKFLILFLLSSPVFAQMEVKEVEKPACVFKKEPISCGLIQALANKVKADEVKKESRFVTKYTLKEI